MATMADLLNASEKGWIVVGWFTPEYRPLAERLASQLDGNGAPYHLYAIGDFGGSFFERTRFKPQIVQRAIEEYPERTIVLMDVDCLVNGDIAPLIQKINADVGIMLKPRQGRPPRITLAASSRVMVFRPTPGARRFVETWASLCASPENRTHDDEMCLAWAYVLCPARCEHIPLEYAAREVGYAAGKQQIIAHASENARRNPQRLTLKSVLRRIERRFFRTGKSAAWKEAHLG